ncbi:hypothetical protein [Thioalkalivibrio thiocyanodenitrificans]|uniref:hypothetical protein n=1 Tax=Thioalkalivibrio thiocyanodenitrificans TaxID=243063 RepID=UPI0003815011|nr:hypothetical protein [Thioalkalivibrio thiocyanodenitrificans]
MPTFYAFLGTTGTQSLEYRWNGFCTDFNHVDGSDTFSGVMWLREGARYVGGTSVGTVPDFTMTVAGGSYDGVSSYVSFMPTGQLSIDEPGVTRATFSDGSSQTFTGATALSATSGGFSGYFSLNPDTLSGYQYLDGLVLYSGGHQIHSYFGSDSFTWVRGLPACTPI